MKSFIRSLVRSGLPLRWRRWIRHWFAWRWFRGDYKSWEQAKKASSGYHHDAILRKAAEAARKVQNGGAAWERDGFAFVTPWLNQPLLKALFNAAESNERQLMVVDIGGAFGGVLRQHWDSLKNFEVVKWRVVEQPDFVTVGQKEFSDSILSFHSSLAVACEGQVRHVVLLSSVLPYLEFPNRTVEEIVSAGFQHVIIDRTPFSHRSSNRLVVQHVPPDLGGGSYPCWIFNRDILFAGLLREYEMIAEWPGFDELDPGVEFRGFHFRRRMLGWPSRISSNQINGV